MLVMVVSEVLWSKSYGEITHYAVGQVGDRYYFSWSEWRWPREGMVPASNIEDGFNGIAWYPTLEKAVVEAIYIIEESCSEYWAAEAREELKELLKTSK